MTKTIHQPRYVPEQPNEDPRYNALRNQLKAQAREGLYRSLVSCPRPSQASGDATAYWITLCGNDYLGLTQHPHVHKEAHRALKEAGAGAGSSRLISGDLPCHHRLEEELSDFLGTESALLFSSGYHANIGILTAMARGPAPIVSDALNHASIIDGCRLSRAPVRIMPHNDVTVLERILSDWQVEAGSSSPLVSPPLVVTEGLFSMEGDRSPIPTIKACCRRAGALLVVDDAHAVGALGNRGEGLSAVGLPEGADVVVGTFGKAFGSAGAFVAGPRVVREALINFARTFIFTTALHPAAAGAALGALEVIRDDPEPRERLRANASRLREGLRQLGFQLGHAKDHIIPLVVGDDHGAMALAEQLREKGIFVRGVRPPTVPVGTSRIRITASALHTEEMIDRVLSIFEKVRPERRDEHETPTT